MKKFLHMILEILFWLLDFDNILVFILIPGGLIALGVMIEAGWQYYPIALGIYAAILWILNRIINKLLGAGIKAVTDLWKKRKK